MDDVGEQHRHLLVLRRSRGASQRRAAFATELGCRAYFSATRPAACVVHAIIVSPQDSVELPDRVNSVQVTVGRRLAVAVVLDAVLGRQFGADQCLAALVHEVGIVEERPDQMSGQLRVSCCSVGG